MKSIIYYSLSLRVIHIHYLKTDTKHYVKQLKMRYQQTLRPLNSELCKVLQHHPKTPELGRVN